MTALRLVLKFPRLVFFVLFFLRELTEANLQLVLIVLRPRDKMHPGIVAVPTRAATDLERTILANLISLTPGTLTLEIDEDESILYVHGIVVRSRDEFIAQVARLEAQLLKAMR